MQQTWKICEHITENQAERTTQRKEAAALVRTLLGT